MNAALFEPHGHCYNWQPSILWQSTIYDIIIALSFFIIAKLIQEKVSLPDESWAKTLFLSVFITCAFTHIMDIVTIFQPWYYFQVYLKGICAGVSVCTALTMWLYRKR